MLLYLLLSETLLNVSAGLKEYFFKPPNPRKPEPDSLANLQDAFKIRT